MYCYHLAASAANNKVLKFIDNEAKISEDFKDNCGKFAMDYATDKYNIKIIEYLFNKNINQTIYKTDQFIYKIILAFMNASNTEISFFETLVSKNSKLIKFGSSIINNCVKNDKLEYFKILLKYDEKFNKSIKLRDLWTSIAQNDNNDIFSTYMMQECNINGFILNQNAENKELINEILCCLAQYHRFDMIEQLLIKYKSKFHQFAKIKDVKSVGFIQNIVNSAMGVTMGFSNESQLKPIQIFLPMLNKYGFKNYYHIHRRRESPFSDFSRLNKR